MKNAKKREVEALSTIPYQFTPVPTNLFILLDINCRSMLFTLIQLSTYYADNDGYFFRTNLDLQQESDLSQKLVIATIDTLYRNGIIDVISVGKAKGKQSNRIKINFDKIIEYEKYSIDELKNPLLKISMVDYKEKGYCPQYLQYNSLNNLNNFSDISQITNNIDNINNKENIENKEDINSNIIEYNNNIKKIEAKSKPSISKIELISESDVENSRIEEDEIITLDNTSIILNNNFEIIDTSMEDKEEEFRDKINHLFNIGASTESLLINLASTDWDCYLYYKSFLNRELKSEYIAHRELIETLNNEYSIPQQYAS